jgi:hypothetical protein
MIIGSKEKHVCPAKWRVWHDSETIDEGKVIAAYDVQEAAETWARREDVESADYYIVGGSEQTVSVANENEYQKLEEDDSLDDTLIKRFVVSGETVAVYHARKV